MKNIEVLIPIVTYMTYKHWVAAALTNIGIVTAAGYTKDSAELKLNTWIQNENLV